MDNYAPDECYTQCYFTFFTFRLHLLGEEVRRQNNFDPSEGDGANSLISWPCTVGYVYKSDGGAPVRGSDVSMNRPAKASKNGFFQLSEEATKTAYEIFNAILEEARNYFSREFKPNKKHHFRDKNRLLTFYNSRTKKAMDSLKKDGGCSSDFVLGEVEVALNSFRNAFSLEAGDDLEHCRLELFGSNLPLPGGDVVIPGGAASVLEAMVREMPPGTVRLCRKVALVDWSLLSRDPRLMDKASCGNAMEQEYRK